MAAPYRDVMPSRVSQACAATNATRSEASRAKQIEKKCLVSGVPTARTRLRFMPEPQSSTHHTRYRPPQPLHSGGARARHR